MRFERIFPYGWNPETSVRERHTRIRRRERKLDLERQEREFACHGCALVDISEPVIGGDDAMHPLRVQAILEIRMRRVYHESNNLAVYFASKCWVTKAEHDAMVAWWWSMVEARGMPKAMATHSTHPGTAPTTIPALGPSPF